MIALESGWAKQVIEQASVQAAQAQVELLDDDNPRVRQRAASTILDHAGIRAGQGAPALQGISAEQIDLLMQTWKECEEMERGNGQWPAHFGGQSAQA